MNPNYTFSIEELAYLWALHGGTQVAHLVLRADMGENVLQKPLLEQRMTAAAHSLLARGLLEQNPTQDGVQAISPVRDLFGHMSSALLSFQYVLPAITGAIYLAESATVVQERRYGVVYDFWVYPHGEAVLRLAERLGLPAQQREALPAPTAKMTPALFERVLGLVETNVTDAEISLAASGFEPASARALVQALRNMDARGEVALLSASSKDAGIQLSGWRFVRGAEVLWWFPVGPRDQVLPAYQLTPAQSAELLATWFDQVVQAIGQSGAPAREEKQGNAPEAQ